MGENKQTKVHPPKTNRNIRCQQKCEGHVPQMQTGVTHTSSFLTTLSVPTLRNILKFTWHSVSKGNTYNGTLLSTGVVPRDSCPSGFTPEVSQVALNLSAPATGFKEGSCFTPTGLEAIQCMIEQGFFPMSFPRLGLLAALSSQRSTTGLEEK